MKRRNWIARLVGMIVSLPFMGKAFNSNSETFVKTTFERGELEGISTYQFTYSKGQVIALARCYKANWNSGANRTSKAVCAASYKLGDPTPRDMISWFEIAESIHAVWENKGERHLHDSIPEALAWIREGLDLPAIENEPLFK